MINSPFDNVKPLERLARLVIGSLLVASIFNPGVTAYWLALLAVYPFITAIMAWDPLYALMDQIKLHSPTKSRMATHAHA